MSTTSVEEYEHLPAAIRLIERDLLPGADPRHRRVYRRLIRDLINAHQLLTTRADPQQPGSIGVMDMGIEAPTDDEDLRVWGQKLRLRREAAGLCREALAERAEISESTIRNIEKGCHQPSRLVVMRLQAVRELGMPSPYGCHPLAGLRADRCEPGPGGPGTAGNCWFMRPPDMRKLTNELVRTLSGPGGHLEQTLLYLAPASAGLWSEIAEQGRLAELYADAPIAGVARVVRTAVAPLPVDVIGLGPGKAMQEVQLTRSLYAQGLSDMRLFLLEINQLLLCAGYTEAARQLSDLRGVEVFAIQANFHSLPRYTQITSAPRRRRLACMLGNTFASLENEEQFVTSTLSGLSQGDLFLIEVPAALAPADHPELIAQWDPRLSEKLPMSTDGLECLYERFFAGPFRRLLPGAKDFVLSTELDLSVCPVPGSYALKSVATVRLETGEERRFELGYRKRYEPTQLDAFMAKNGWIPMKAWRYAEWQQPLLFMLYRKIGR